MLRTVFQFGMCAEFSLTGCVAETLVLVLLAVYVVLVLIEMILVMMIAVIMIKVMIVMIMVALTTQWWHHLWREVR